MRNSKRIRLEQRRAAQAAQAELPPAVATVSDGHDYGPGLRRDEGGRLVDWGGASNVEVTWRADPEYPDKYRPVRGSRRRHAIFDLLLRRVITKRMFDAAQQYLDDCSIATGGSAPESFGMGGSSWPNAAMPERQLNAVTRVNEVHARFDMSVGTVFWWVVLNNGALTEFCSYRGIRNGSATDGLVGVLHELDEHYHRSRRTETT